MANGLAQWISEKCHNEFDLYSVNIGEAGRLPETKSMIRSAKDDQEG